MSNFMKTKCPGFHSVDMGHDFTGPYNNRKLSTSSWIEFSNTDTAKNFTKKATSEELSIEGVTITMKPDRTKVQKKRN